MSCSLTSLYVTADDFHTGGKSSDHLSMCFSLVPAILIRCFKMNDIVLLNDSSFLLPAVMLIQPHSVFRRYQKRCPAVSCIVI